MESEVEYGHQIKQLTSPELSQYFNNNPIFRNTCIIQNGLVKVNSYNSSNPSGKKNILEYTTEFVTV